MSKLSYILGVEKNIETMTVQGTIKDVMLYVNGLGWLTLEFFFEGDNRPWMVYHLNENPYQEILLWFLRKNLQLGEESSEKILLSEEMERISFDGGETWISIYECDGKMFQSFKGQSVTLKCKKFAENQIYLSDGAVSFDNGKTWFDIDARKDELDKEWFKNGGTVDFILL